MHKLAIKLFFTEPSPHLDDFVPVFHTWIQTHALPNHLLFDVADYKHVPTGPGMILITHQANIAIDQANHRPGLLYTRKSPLATTSLADNLREVLSYTLQAAALLESTSALPNLKFKTDELLIQINDRLEAPNTPETSSKLSPTIQQVANTLFGHPVTLEHSHDDSRSLFEVRIKSSQSPTLAQLSQNIK